MKDDTEKSCLIVSSKGLLKSCDFVKKNMIMSYVNNDSQILEGIKDGSSLYVPTSNLGIFVNNLLPRLTKYIVLVTGDDDQTIPNSFPIQFQRIVESKYILHWFSQNCNIIHPTVSHLPIGLDYHTLHTKNSDWGPKTSPINQEKEILEIFNMSLPYCERELKIYSNFHFQMERGDRKEAYDNIPKDLIYYEPEKVTRIETFKNQSKFAFVASPFGAGPDCHRTWEAISLGCIPIIKSSKMDKLFEGLPVLIVSKWSDVTGELLKNTIDKFRNENMKFSLQNPRMNLQYWIDRINSYKTIPNKRNIVIVGTCKSISKHFEKSKNNIMKIAMNFDNYKIVIIENDSTDNTRELLKVWQKEDNNVRIITFDGLYKDVKYRTEVLAFCRNVCMQEVNNLNFSEYPYTLFVDMDDVLTSEKFTIDGVKDSISHLNKDKSLASVCAVIDGEYYDIWALRNEECNYDCWQEHKKYFPQKMSWMDAQKICVAPHKKNYSNYEGLIYLKSAFGGASIYRNEYWLKSKYFGITVNNLEICEHVPMNEKLIEMGYKIGLNPKFILY